jgi:hypothetical protein
MTRVSFTIPLAGATLRVDQDEEHFQMYVGKWLVEVIGGVLVVREPGRAVNETPLLKVPA